MPVFGDDLPANDPRYVFADGARWWRQTHGQGVGPEDMNVITEEAERRYPLGVIQPPLLTLGTWAYDDLRRVFTDGAAWWEYYSTQFTMWNSDRRLVEAQADLRYPSGRPSICPYCTRGIPKLTDTNMHLVEHDVVAICLA